MSNILCGWLCGHSSISRQSIEKREIIGWSQYLVNKYIWIHVKNTYNFFFIFLLFFFCLSGMRNVKLTHESV